MGKVLVLTALIAVVSAVLWYTHKPPELPKLDPDEWWGHPDLISRNDTSIRPFIMRFLPEMVTDLQYRLKHHRKYTKPLEGIAFQYGFNTRKLYEWLVYWEEDYPFDDRERTLNKYPQFLTNIQGVDIHFFRIYPEIKPGSSLVPILLLHGWPGSVVEFHEAIGLMTKGMPGYNFVFDIIVPSLPGFGFSEAPIRPGLGMVQMAVMMKNLMRRLNYHQFYVQGGDWGAGIGAAMATLYPDTVLGFHTNMAFVRNGPAMFKTLVGAVMPSLVVEPHLYERMYPLSDFLSYVIEEFGYFHVQATKPDSIGVALNDSPAGLLAYIFEKFATWTNRENKFKVDGGLLERFQRYQLIDNLMIYWAPRSITTSMRLYAETFSQRNRQYNLDSFPTTVPTWVLQAKHELFYQPPSILKTKFVNLLNTTVLDDGGHFIAFEMPRVYVEDVFRAVNAIREWRDNPTKTEL